MTQDMQNNHLLAFRLLAAAGLILIVATYVSPIWWVTMRAPQYSEITAPQGIRVHFHVDSVQNGCTKLDTSEKHEVEPLNCMEEMNAISHFIGMYPIAAGGPVERALAPFLFSILGVMIVGFMIDRARVRTAVMAAACIAIAAWAGFALDTKGGWSLMSPAYMDDVVSTMQLEPEDYADWSGFQVIEESYRDALGRYFRDPIEIERKVGVTMTVANTAFWGMLGVMVVLVVGAAVVPAFYWLLVLVPALLPVFFAIDYSSWLWWFGHNLNEMGAFSLKPFMPTVFGVGKVAQFSTYSYPHYGFGLMVAASVVLLLAALVRRKHLRSLEEQ